MFLLTFEIKGVLWSELQYDLCVCALLKHVKTYVMVTSGCESASPKSQLG